MNPTHHQIRNYIRRLNRGWRFRKNAFGNAIIIGAILWVILIAIVLLVRGSEAGPTLIHEPCLPGYEVWVDEVLQDHCTDSESNGLQGWHP